MSTPTPVIIRCKDPILHSIMDARISELAEVVKAAVLFIEDVPPEWADSFDATARQAYERLKCATGRIQ